MSTIAADILADSDGSGKLIAGVVMLLIWGIGALIKVASKQSQESRQRREKLNWEMAEQMRQAAILREQARMQQAPPRMPQASPMQIPMMQRPQGRPVQQQQRRQQQRRPMPPPIPRQQQQRKASRTPPPLLEEIPVAEAIDTRAAAATRQAPAGPSRRQSAPAISVARISGKLTPQVLRQQIVLMEILQPPLALREDVAGGHHSA
jgi:hypothetical protein